MSSCLNEMRGSHIGLKQSILHVKNTVDHPLGTVSSCIATLFDMQTNPHFRLFFFILFKVFTTVILGYLKIIKLTTYCSKTQHQHNNKIKAEERKKTHTHTHTHTHTRKHTDLKSHIQICRHLFILT